MAHVSHYHFEPATVLPRLAEFLPGVLVLYVMIDSDGVFDRAAAGQATVLALAVGVGSILARPQPALRGRHANSLLTDIAKAVATALPTLLLLGALVGLGGSLRHGYGNGLAMVAPVQLLLAWGLLQGATQMALRTMPRANRLVERRPRRVDLDALAPDWSLQAASLASGRLEQALRRVADIAESLLLLTLTMPVLCITALLVRLSSPGPVIYRQVRVGKDGKEFMLLKFRSMRTDAEARGPVWATTGDERVTRVGSFIRLIRIDELPQLVNVLKGEMSFIGPRPERPHFVAQLEQQVPFYADRALVKPGLTGWAQVNYPYGASVEDARAKLSYDLYYVKHRSLLLDVLILLATVRVVLFRHGAR